MAAGGKCRKAEMGPENGLSGTGTSGFESQAMFLFDFIHLKYYLAFLLKRAQGGSRRHQGRGISTHPCLSFVISRWAAGEVLGRP